MELMPSIAAGTQTARTPAVDTRIKILLVDDTPENLVSLEAALSGLDGELVFARSGREALHHVLNDDFAAILLDVRMPEMDGFENRGADSKPPSIAPDSDSVSDGISQRGAPVSRL